MRKLLLIFLSLNLLLVAALAGLYYLSETYPFHPGDKLYAVQNLAEQSRLSLSHKGEQGARLALSLAERRLTNLAHAQNPQRIQAAAIAFDQALSTLLAYTDGLSPDQHQIVLADLNALLRQAELVVFSIDKSCCETIDILHARITTLLQQDQEQLDPPDTVRAIAEAPAVISAMSISFLGQEIDHSSFPLLGAHATSDCLACHINGQYVGTPSQCEDCHVFQPVIEVTNSIFPVSFSQEDVTNPHLNYPQHFDGPCQDCHDAVSWDPIAFDHQDVVECLSCHQQDVTDIDQASPVHALYTRPCTDCHLDTQDWTITIFDHSEAYDCLSCHQPELPDHHYLGDCQKCHVDVDNWNNYVFFHLGYQDCQDCHTQPPGHYGDNCTTCHYSTQGWAYADFDHTGFKDCKGCHTADAPANHFNDQCSRCHNTKAWNKAQFYHDKAYSIYACSNCHLKDAPAGHYCEDCCRCHNVNNWKNINFSHYNLTDCVDCHSKEAPAGHYEGQCSRCHNTGDWGQIHFDHTGYTDCADCHTADTPANHYGDDCARCHNTNNWKQVVFDHRGFPDCVACHAAETPDSHYAGQCSKCHSTDTWKEINFNHVDLDNCTGCHADDAPKDHWPGQCSNCHISTKDWNKIKFDHSSLFKDCRSCHYDEPVPAGHPTRGQCSKCHTTDTWVIAPTPTPDADDLRELSSASLLAALAADLPAIAETPAPTLQPTLVVTPTPVQDTEEPEEEETKEPVSTPAPAPTATPDPAEPPPPAETPAP